MRKLTDTTIHSLRERVMAAPTRSPMGVMAPIGPSVNSPIPPISSTAPMRKVIRVAVGMGAMEKHRTKRSARWGVREERASHLSRRMVLPI